MAQSGCARPAGLACCAAPSSGRSGGDRHQRRGARASPPPPSRGPVARDRCAASPRDGSVAQYGDRGRDRTRRMARRLGGAVRQQPRLQLPARRALPAERGALDRGGRRAARPRRRHPDPPRRSRAPRSRRASRRARGAARRSLCPGHLLRGPPRQVLGRPLCHLGPALRDGAAAGRDAPLGARRGRRARRARAPPAEHGPARPGGRLGGGPGRAAIARSPAHGFHSFRRCAPHGPDGRARPSRR